MACAGLLCLCSLAYMGGCPQPEPTPEPTFTPGKYVGAKVSSLESQGCQRCHSGQHDNWAMTNHSKALDTLKAIGQDKNAFCLPCHTVGFGEEGGFVSETASPHLAGVQCENCHGPGRDHVNNVDDPTKRPPKSIAANICGRCHNGVHHPTFDEWSDSKHALVTEELAEEFAEGVNLNNCGLCHSGDVRQVRFIEGEDSVDASLLAGKTREEMNGISCAVCHDPHRQTGNAASPEAGKDYQLRYKEVLTPVASNEVADCINPERFNLCGQCHHTRDRTWTATSRGPHHSVQVNHYIGEMPTPDGVPIVPNSRTVHRFVPRQCTTCHMPTKEFESEEEPAESGHTFEVVTRGCTAVGCHPSEQQAVADMNTLQTQIQNGLNAIVARLGPVSEWEYSAAEYGGPSDQSDENVPPQVKKVRFMYHWILNDGSGGVHNPEYTKLMLLQMDLLLKEIGK